MSAGYCVANLKKCRNVTGLQKVLAQFCTFFNLLYEFLTPTVFF